MEASGKVPTMAVLYLVGFAVYITRMTAGTVFFIFVLNGILIRKKLIMHHKLLIIK